MGIIFFNSLINFGFLKKKSDGEKTPERSFSSSFIENIDFQELIADQIENKIKKTKNFEEKIEEISSPLTPLSFEGQENKGEGPQQKFNKIIQNEKKCKRKKLHLYEIFQQMKDKPKKNYPLVKNDNKAIIDDFHNEGQLTPDKSDSIIIVSDFLPIRVKKNEKSGWDVVPNEEISIINMISTLYMTTIKDYKNVIFVGWLRDEIPLDDEKELEEFLLKNHKCLPVFINSEQEKFFANLYKHDEITIIDKVAQNFLIGKESLGHSWLERNRYWDIWVSLNQDYANKILSIMKENSMVLICEYNLILVSTYLMKEFSQPLIAQNFNINFPSFEKFLLIPYKEEILNGLLSASIICFNDYDHISDFFTTLSILKEIEFECKQGLTFFKYMERKIYVRIKTPTVDPKMIEILKKEEDFTKSCSRTIIQLKNINLVIGIDPPSDLSALEAKFLMLFQFVKENKNKYSLKLIQFIKRNPYTSPIHSELNDAYRKKINDVANKINNEYLRLVEKENFPSVYQKKLIELKDLNISESEFLSLLAVAKIYLKTSIKTAYSLDVMSFIACNRNFGYALVSDFLNFNKLCKTILRFNPLKYSEFKEKMNFILHSEKNVTALLQSDDIVLLQKSSISNWFESLIVDLKRIGNMMKNSSKLENIERHNNLLLTKMMIINESFQYLSIPNIVSDYKKRRNRLILLDYEGTLVKYNYYTCISRTYQKYSGRFHLVSLKPEESLIKDILFLASDPDNFVYIITGNKVEYLDHWFGHLLNVGLAAEYGFFYKNKGSCKWGALFSMDWSWKEIVKKIFELYKRNTEGSEIESKDSCIAWKYHEVQKDFGKKQAEELKNHLKSSLEYFKQIEIFQGSNYIEVRPKGINKVTLIYIKKYIN